MKIRFHPALFILIICFIILGQYFQIFAFLLALTLHEFAHAYTAKKLGYQLEKFCLLPYGACLNYKNQNMQPDHEMLIALAGPVCNLCIGILVVAIWWVVPSIYSISYAIFSANFILGFYNLFPAYPLDGGRIFLAIFSKKYDRENGVNICIILNVIFGTIFLSMFLFSIFTKINFNYLFVAVFVFIGIFESKFETKYIKYNINFANNIKNNQYFVKILGFSGNYPLYKIIGKLNKRKINIIFVRFSNGEVKMFSDKKILDVAKNFSLQDNLEEIFYKSK